MNCQLHGLDYKPLHGEDIRLIRFCTGTNSHDHLELQLEHFSCPPPYLALSYVWGDPNDTKRIRVNGQPFLVTVNLHATLMHLSQLSSILREGIAKAAGAAKAEVYLWVDAICIDQGNLEEKARQVSRMGQVYSSALTVLIWLGTFKDVAQGAEGGFGLEILMEALHLASPLELFSKPDLVFNYGRDMSILSIGHKALIMVKSYGSIMMHDYFQRVWVIQEDVLSQRKACAVIGLALFSFDSLFMFGEILQQLFDHPNKSIREEVGTKARLVEYIFQVALRPKLMRAELLSKDLRQNPLAYQLLWSYTNLGPKNCGVAHDHIYGLLGMFNVNQLPKQLIPDYSKPFEDVFRSFSALIIDETKDLRLLMFSQPSKLEGQPSWVVDFRHTFPWQFEPVTLHTGCFVPQSDALIVEGVQTGCVISYFSGAQDTSGKMMEEFHDTILATAAGIKDQTLITTWKNWFANFLQDECAQPRHYAGPFPTAARFVSPHLYEENRTADDGFDRNLVLGSFGLSEFCLVSDGTVASCHRRLQYDEPNKHFVYMFKGSTQTSIICTEDEQDYRYVGWILEHEFPFDEKELLSGLGTKISLI